MRPLFANPSRQVPTWHARGTPFPTEARGLAGVLRLLALGVLLAYGARAAMPPAESLVPPDATAIFTVPNAAQARADFIRTSLGGWWNDPAMAAFRASLTQAWSNRFAQPLRQLTGLDLETLAAQTQGQLTLATLATNATHANPGERWLLILEGSSTTNAAGGSLSTTLREWRAQRPPSTTFTRGGATIDAWPLDFAALRTLFDTAFPPLESASETASKQATPKNLPPRATPVAPQGTSPALYTVQAKRVFVAGSALADVELVLDRLAAPATNSALPATPGDALLQVWVKLGAGAGSTEPPAPPTATNALMPRLVHALGADELRAMTFTWRRLDPGWGLQTRFEIPAAARRGLVQALAWAPLDASPPLFVDTRTLYFARARIAGRALWDGIENSLRAFDTTLLGVVQLFTGYAGRTEDADFDFEKGLIHQLGDDWMLVEGPPAAKSNVAATAGTLIVGSPAPATLTHAIRLIAAPSYLATFVPPDAPNPERTERPVGEHTLTRVVVPPIPWIGEQETALSFLQLESGVGLSVTDGQLESLVAPTPSPLQRDPAFQRAAEKVGGTRSGFFTYLNERATGEAAFARVRGDPEYLPRKLRWLAVSDVGARALGALRGWADFAKLPPFPSVARHFGIATQSGRVTPAGFEFQSFHSPTTIPSTPPPPLPPPAAPTKKL